MTFNNKRDVGASSVIDSFMSDWSIEIIPTSSFSCREFSEDMRSGCSIYVTWIPGQDIGMLLEASKNLRACGFEPIPHIAARAVRDIGHLNTLLTRLELEAGVQKLLVLGGDTETVSGPFKSSRELLESGILGQHGFKEIGFATYPEPHSRIPQATLDSELLAKLRIASQLGLKSWLVSQLCFDASAIMRHIEKLRAADIHASIQIGFAGPTTWKGMLKFATICGVSASARSLSQVSKVKRLLSGFEPSDQITRIASFSANSAFAGSIKPHFFTFGGARKTVAWLNAFVHQASRISEATQRAPF
jgi:methylenetetrahydrofolate reductase (NADPH)